MALYVKANRLVAEYLEVDKIRLKLQDGNYMLWQADMLTFGRLYEIKQICERIGALALQPWEARQEQDGTVLRPLPIATDERFVIDTEDTQVDEVVEIDEVIVEDSDAESEVEDV